MIGRRPRADGEPIVGNWPAACAAPLDWNSAPAAKIGRGAIGLQYTQFGNGFGRVYVEPGQGRMGRIHCPIPFIRAANGLLKRDNARFDFLRNERPAKVIAEPRIFAGFQLPADPVRIG